MERDGRNGALEFRGAPPGTRAAWRKAPGRGLAAAMLLMTACASPPSVRDPSALPPLVLRSIGAVVVDADPAGKKLTAKDEQTGTTWTILVLESTRIATDRGVPLRMEDLRSGERVLVRGSSRIEEVLTAEEIAVTQSD